MKIKKIISVLLIEDHPVLLDAYEMIFNLVNKKRITLEFNIEKAMDFESAALKINYASKKEGFDIVFLDLRLGKSHGNQILAGEELGLMIRQLMPKTRIIVLTSYSAPFILNSIFKKINPLGFLIKSDADFKCLQKAVISVISNKPYYSCTINELIRKNNKIKFSIDEIDRKIVYELSIGTKISNMPNFIPLSKAGIERRLRCLKINLKLKGKSNRELILIAKDKGIL